MIHFPRFLLDKESLYPARFLVILLLLPPSAFAASGFLVEPAGQATGNTCQSYSLAVALATRQDPMFLINTAADLRNAELDIRTRIIESSGADAVTHTHIQSGFRTFTNGKYVLKFKDVAEADIADHIASATGITSASAALPSFLLGAVAKDVVLASARRIGAHSYAEGHIFTIYGVDGPPDSNRRYLVLNSAVKVKGKRYNCEDGLPDDPGNYSASLSWITSNDISFKLFGNKVRLWVIEKGQ